MGELDRIEPNFVDRVIDYYNNQSELSPKDMEILERCELAFRLVKKHRSKAKAASALVALLKKTENVTISIRTAFRDINLSERIFVPISKIDKEAMRMAVVESAMRDIKLIEEKIKEGKGKESLTPTQIDLLLKSKHRAEVRIIKACGLEDHSEGPDFESLQPHQFQIELPPLAMEILSKLIGAGKVDVTQLMSQMNNIADAEIIQPNGTTDMDHR
jgi:hypothetical protein